MEESISYPLSPADPATFTGQAYTARVARSAGEAPTQVYYVRFEPRARTNWHAHSGTQLLLIQEGVCLLQRASGGVERHPAGSTVRIEPGERHWHGAAPEEPRVHVAINLSNERTDWQEPVSEAEYANAGPGYERR